MRAVRLSLSLSSSAEPAAEPAPAEAEAVDDGAGDDAAAATATGAARTAAGALATPAAPAAAGAAAGAAAESEPTAAPEALRLCSPSGDGENARPSGTAAGVDFDTAAAAAAANEAAGAWLICLSDAAARAAAEAPNAAAAADGDPERAVEKVKLMVLNCGSVRWSTKAFRASSSSFLCTQGVSTSVSLWPSSEFRSKLSSGGSTKQYEMECVCTAESIWNHICSEASTNVSKAANGVMTHTDPCNLMLDTASSTGSVAIPMTFRSNDAEILTSEHGGRTGTLMHNCVSRQICASP